LALDTKLLNEPNDNIRKFTLTQDEFFKIFRKFIGSGGCDNPTTRCCCYLTIFLFFTRTAAI